LQALDFLGLLFHGLGAAGRQIPTSFIDHHSGIHLFVNTLAQLFHLRFVQSNLALGAFERIIDRKLLLCRFADELFQFRPQTSLAPSNRLEKRLMIGDRVLVFGKLFRL
jgi:hypothetical protein